MTTSDAIAEAMREFRAGLLPEIDKRIDKRVKNLFNKTHSTRKTNNNVFTHRTRSISGNADRSRIGHQSTSQEVIIPGAGKITLKSRYQEFSSSHDTHSPVHLAGARTPRVPRRLADRALGMRGS